MAFNAGNLRHRVRLERYAIQLDTAGDPIQNEVTGELDRDWELIAEVWADISPLSAREFVASAAGASQVSARITIRWRNDFTAADRIVHNGTIYNIAGVLTDVDSGREYITMPVSQGVNDGGM